jgi:hypothetical protein
MNTHNRLYALLLCGLALLVLLGQAPQAQAQNQQLQSPQARLGSSLQATAPLDMTGDWKLTYGYNLAGCCTRTYNVHFDKTTANSYNGFHYTGYYKPGGDPHSPLLDDPNRPLTADTFYGGRGQVVVQLVEHVVESGKGYFGLLSGYHVPTTTGVQILGVWTNIDKYQGTFTLNKVP